LFDALWIHILRRLEAFPDATFRESELISVSKSFFDEMLKDKMLEFSHRDGDGDSYFSDRSGDGGVQRTIRIRNKKISAFSTESGVETIQLEETETVYYRFNLGKLIDLIRSHNKLEEAIDHISDRLSFVGSLQIADGRVSIYFGLFDDVDDFGKELKGLPNSVGRYVRHIVICPFVRISCQKTRNALSGIKVSQFTFEEAFGKEFVFKSGLVLSEATLKLPQTLRLTGKVESEKHVVSLDSKEGGLTDANFKLLLELVVALKTTKEGWVATGEGDWQAYGRLKDDFKRSFDGFDFDGFIKNGRKKYRLVIEPDNVTYDRAMLKKIKNNAVITELADKLPIIRKGK
jgi:hypothetical protein